MSGTSETKLKSLMMAGLAADRATYRTLLGHLCCRPEVFFGRRLTETPADVDDLVQETLIAIRAKRESFDRAQAFTPWVQSFIDHLRPCAAGRPPLENSEEVFTEDASARDDARGDVERAFALVPDRSRAGLRSVKLERLSTAEATERRGVSESAVNVDIHRSVRRLAAGLLGGSKADERRTDRPPLC